MAVVAWILQTVIRNCQQKRLLMPIFDKHFYQLGDKNYLDIDGYRTTFQSAFYQYGSSFERDRLLRQEAVEITHHITDGIRDLVEHNRHVRHLVLNLGAVPLATWAEALDTLAQYSIPALQQKIAEMQRDLEHGKVEGFPGTMFLYHKPTFTTLEPFYKVVFELAG